MFWVADPAPPPYSKFRLGGLVIGVEHVGCTSVPGEATKPINDLDLLVEDTEMSPCISR